jgi:predicted RNA binding protein with dsRBD fold (UPF0201 family)
MASPIPASAVGEALRKHVDPNGPAPLRMMAARGLVPMPPRDTVTVLSILTHDEDEKVRLSAQKSLSELPERMFQGAIKEALHPLVLDQLARSFENNEAYLETILLNKETPDETFAFVADRVNERLLGIVIENQVRLLRHKQIVQGVLANPNVLKSQIDRLMDFAVRTGMSFKGMDAYEEAKARISGAPRDTAEERRIQKVIVESLPEDMLREEPEDELGIDEDDVKKRTILQRLHEMTIAQKVALAMKGNKTIRSQLLKDRNKMVAVAAIKNPGVNEGEIIAVAGNRSVCDDVIRIISQNREWTRNYQVKLALMNNPKTPIGTALRFLPSIRAADLKGMSGNKNIPSALAQAAKKLLTKRQGGGH